jgi:hypothetical protein
MRLNIFDCRVSVLNADCLRFRHIVTPAKAGGPLWIPASAGMTVQGAAAQRQRTDMLCRAAPVEKTPHPLFPPLLPSPPRQGEQGAVMNCCFCVVFFWLRLCRAVLRILVSA